MRENKFRAREKETGEWVIGNIHPQGNEVSLAVLFANIQVGRFDIETLGQFVNPPDKNGKEIYEGDICRNGKEIGLIKWHRDLAMFSVDRRYPCNKGLNLEFIQFLADWLEGAEVIGNIHTNPELLGGNIGKEVTLEEV